MKIKLNSCDILLIDRSVDFSPYLLKEGIWEVKRVPSLWKYIPLTDLNFSDWLVLENNEKVGLPIAQIEKLVENKQIEILE